MRITALALCAFLFAGAAFAANPFADVSRDHWAYDAIQKCVNAGILQGFDGKFHGKKLLNRYQVAVIVAKILDKVKGGMPAGMAPKSEDIQNLEALTIEFADELALLNVKVSTLEDSFVELKHDVEKLKGAGPVAHAPMASGGFGLQGFASFGLMMTDKDNGYTGVGNDSTYFTNPFVSLAIKKDLGEGVVFNLRLMHESDVNVGASDASIDQAYFQVDELLGENVGGKIGAFDFSQMSMETNGAFDTPDYTITESFLNRTFRKFHAYGVEFAQNEKKMAANDIKVKFAILSGTDDSADLLAHPSSAGSIADEFGSIESATEADDSFGYYLFVKKDRAESNFGWNFFYFDNGADASAGAVGQNDEQSIMMLGLDYAKDDLQVLFQYAKSDADLVGGAERQNTDMFLLLNYKLDEKQSISLRYEDSETENATATIGEFTAMTLAWNRQITDNSMLQFEYLTVDDDFGGAVDADDDVIQLRYKVWF